MMRRSSRFDVPGQLAALRRYALALTRDEGDAEDLVQDALVRAYDRRSTFDERRDLKSWLLSIVHNAFIDGVRSRRAERVRMTAAGELADGRSEPAQEHAVRLAQVRASFAALPHEQRAALHLVAVEGLSYADAAAVLGVPAGTLMSRVGRARDALRQIEQPETERRLVGPLSAAPRRGPHLRIVGASDEHDD
jgi:RNA polymerase sigma factor (sigma-70 family)